MDRWLPEIRQLFTEDNVWISDSLAVESVGKLEVLTWRKTQQAYCVTEALVWAELDTAERGTIYVLLRAVRWPPDGGDFGSRRPSWAPTSSPYGPIDNVRFLTTPPGTPEVSGIWPPSMFGVGGFPVIQGEVFSTPWRDLIGADPLPGSYRLDPGANVNC